MIKEIPLNGYTAQPSDMLCPDGELAAAVNVLPEDSGLKAILNPEIVKRMPLGSKILATHKGDTFFNYIVLVTTTITLPGHSGGQPTTQTNSNIYWMDANGEFEADATHLISDGANIVHVNVIGNTLVLFNENTGLNYYLWRNGNYHSLGTQIPFPSLKFALSGGPVLSSDINYSGRRQGDIIANYIGNETSFAENEQSNVSNTVFGRINKDVKHFSSQGKFVYPFFIRYALRLYDETLILHSAPVLMCPSTKELKVYFVNMDSVNGNNCLYSDVLWFPSSVLCKLADDGAYEQFARWKDIVRSVDIFISSPLYPWNQSKMITGISGYGGGSWYAGKCKFIGEIADAGNIHRVSFNGNNYSIGTMSPLFRGMFAEWDYDLVYASCKDTDVGEAHLQMPYYSDAELQENMANASNYYHILSIDTDKLGDYKTNLKKLDINGDFLNALETREAMSDDFLSHDKLLAKQSYVYNSRLNLTQVSRKLFNGFRPDAIFAYTNYGLVEQGFDIPGGMPRCRFIVNTKYASTTTGEYIAFEPTNINADVFIKESGNIFKVSATTSEKIGQFLSDDVTGKTSRAAFFFYPNPNAFMLRITEHDVYGQQRTFECELKQHPFLNAAYAIWDYHTARVSDNVQEETITNNSNKVELPNKIYTSDVNNPFLFPARSINTVGTGRIVGIISATKALSQGQFGQFPLYAFTTEGVWAMEITNTGDFSAKQPVTRDIVFGNGESITQLDNAVLFATNRGIMLISGSQSVCISESIDDNDAVFSVGELPHINELQAIAAVSMPNSFAPGSFRDFIKDCRMIYDYTNQRIIVYNAVVEEETRKYPYAYIYSLKTKQWGMMLTDITSNFNSYPDAFAQDANCNIVNISQPAAPVGNNVAERKAFIVTRPFKLDAPHALKTIRTIIVRGIFRRGKVKVALYGSKDELQWVLVSSSTSHSLRNISGTPFKYFRLAIIAELSQNEILHSFTVEYVPRMTNRIR